MSIVRRRLPASLVVLLISAMLGAGLMSRGSLVLADANRALPAGGESASVTTDKPDYGPTEIVTIFGSGFAVGEAVSVLVTAPDGSTRSGDGLGSGGPDSVIADANGALVLSYNLPGTLLANTTLCVRISFCCSCVVPPGRVPGGVRSRLDCFERRITA